MRRAIFVSHSTKGDTGLALLNAVADELESKGYRPLVDRLNLVQGDDWYERVETWIMECHGAVLLWDSNAAASPYVQHETSLLSHRWRNEENFGLFVALIDNSPPDTRLTRTALSKSGLHATRITDTHLWSAAESAPAALGDSRALAVALVADAAATLGPAEYSLTRQDKIIESVAALLGRNLTPDQLRAAIDILDLPELRDAVDRAASSRLAHLVAAWMVSQAAVDLAPVRTLSEALLPNLGSGQWRLLQFLSYAEANWLTNGRLDCPVGSALARLGSGAAAAVNGEKTDLYTLEALILGALNPGENYILVKCHDKALDEEEVAEEILAKIDLLGGDNEEIAEVLGQERTVCLLAHGQPIGSRDQGMIQRLRARFPTVIFVAWPSREPFDPAAVSYARPVLPPIVLAEEALRFARWNSLKRVFKHNDPMTGRA
jgi:hypothetical protein